MMYLTLKTFVFDINVFIIHQLIPLLYCIQNQETDCEVEGGEEVRNI